MINSVKEKISRRSFSETAEVFPVPANSDIYGFHPRFICATCDGWKAVKSDADPYAGKSGAVMQARHTEIFNTSSRAEAKTYRCKMLSKYISELRSHSLGLHYAPIFQIALGRAAFDFVDGIAIPQTIPPVADDHIEESPLPDLPTQLDPKFADIVSLTETPPAKKKGQHKNEQDRRQLRPWKGLALLMCSIQKMPLHTKPRQPEQTFSHKTELTSGTRRKNCAENLQSRPGIHKCASSVGFAIWLGNPGLYTTTGGVPACRLKIVLTSPLTLTLPVAKNRDDPHQMASCVLIVLASSIGVRHRLLSPSRRAKQNGMELHTDWESNHWHATWDFPCQSAFTPTRLQASVFAAGGAWENFVIWT